MGMSFENASYWANITGGKIKPLGPSATRRVALYGSKKGGAKMDYGIELDGKLYKSSGTFSNRAKEKTRHDNELFFAHHGSTQL